MTNLLLQRRPIAPGLPTLFLDRDGVVNVDTGYVVDPALVALVPGAAALIARANAAGRPVIVVSNQSALARGLADLATLVAVQDRIEALLAAEGAALDAVLICGAGPGAEGQLAAWRKPAPGMIRAAATLFGCRLEASLLIGDDARDLQAAAAAGVGQAVLVGSSRAGEKKSNGGEPLQGLPALPVVEAWLDQHVPEALHRRGGSKDGLFS